MTTPRTYLRLTSLAMLVALALAGAAGTAATEIVFNESCFPTCDTRDGRLLIMAGGPGLETRSDTPMNLKFHVESTAVAVDPTFTIDIFDGDTLKCSTAGACDPIVGVGEAHWDVGKPAALFFTLYAVAEQLDGSSVMTLVDPAKIELDGGSVAASNPFSGDDMFDDAWFRIRVTVGSEAEAVGSGDYRYQLKMELDPSVVYAANEGTLNALKVRTSASLLLSRVEQPFAFEAKWTNLYDLMLVYPNFDMGDPFNPANAEGSTYDGSFTFFFYVPPPEPGNPRTELSIFDADLDHGNWDYSVVDRDDPDTSGDLGDLPFPVGPEVHLEGESGAAPFDDKAPGGLGLYLARSPAVTYRLTFPPNTDPGTIVCRAGDAEAGPLFNGRPSILNLNPSGNREWESFTLSTALFDGNAMDCHVDSIPSGTYRVDLIGMDMNNLNAWYFAGDVCGQLPDGKSSCIAGTLKLGDTVWFDDDADANSDPAEIAADGESGAPGVLLTLEDGSGRLLSRTLTDVNGLYEFDVAPGEYRVRVANENFTGGISVGGAVGDRVWLDRDGNGNQDTNEPGLNGIEVLLFDAGGDNAVGGGDDELLAAIRTSGDGEYLFSDLPPGTYYTEIAEGSWPAGLMLSAGTNPSAVRTITASETHLDLDFGFTHDDIDTAIVGDFVWHDLDSDGVLDTGEPGIDGVVVSLLDDLGAVVTKTTTVGGHYLFTGVAPGIYQVDVTDELGALTGYSLTTFNDPTPQFLVAAGDALLDKDFGYNHGALYSITDRLWIDVDRDRMFDGGESPIGGVTVALVGADGAVLATTTSAGDGTFTFAGLPDGAYSTVVTDLTGALAGFMPTTLPALAGSNGVRIDGANVSSTSFGYVSTGVLGDLRSTTGGEQIFDTVVDQNVLTYDFGYAPLGASCDTGRPTALVFEYTGDSCSSPSANNNSQTGDSCSGALDGDEPVQLVITRKPERFTVSPSTETIEIGDLVTIAAASSGALMWPNTNVSVRQGGVELQTIVFHTSCSEPLDPGDQFGSLLLRSYVFP